MTRTTIAAALATALILPTAASAQQEMAREELPPEFVEALQKDAATLRMDIMQANIQLEPGEASKFWGIYEEYLDDLGTRVADRTELIRDYAAEYAQMTDEQATELGRRALTLERERLDLLSQYFDRISGEVGGVEAAQFYQIENRADMLIDLRLAMDVPIVQQGAGQP